jgi:Ca-activated chloride channel family protein
VPFEFTNPAGLLLLGALAPLVALYVLRSRRTRHVVSSVWLWRSARRDVLARTPFKRLLPETALLLEAAAIVLFALALAAPSCSGVSARRERVALIVDTSASMGVRGPSGQRLEAAKAAARDVVARAVPPAEIMLIDAGAEAHVVLGLERDARRLVRAIDSLAVRDEEGSLGGAVALAVERFRAAPGPSRVVVVTDGGGEVPAASGTPLEVQRVGSASDNVAILRTDVRRKTDVPGEPERVEVFASLANLGDRSVEGFVTVRTRDGGRTLASRSIALAAHERASTTLGFTPGPQDTGDTGAGIVVELTPGDAFATDDRAYALIPPSPRLPVILMPKGGNPWLQRAFAADDSVELFESDLDAVATGALPRDALSVVSGVCPKSPPLGDLLVFGAPEGDCLGVRVGAATASPAVTSWADRDPRFRFLSLDRLHLHTARALAAPRTAALARAGDTVIAADLGLPGRTGTLLSFGVSDTDWPLDASFVVFVRNVTERAREGRLRASGTASRTGTPLSIPIRDGAKSVSIVGPGGDLPARLIDAVAIAGAPPRAGFYDVIDDDTGRVLATSAVNLWSERESDLRPRPGGPGGANGGQKATEILSASRTSIAFALALGGLAAVLADALWVTRRPRRPARPGAPARPAAARDAPPRRALFASLPGPSRLALAVSLGSALAFAGYALLVRFALVTDRFLRLERPEWTAAGLVAVAVIGVRAALAPPDKGPLRRALVEGGLCLAAIAASLAAAEPALGSAFDRLAIIVAVDRSRSLELSPGAEARIERELEAAEAAMRPDDQLGVIGFAVGAGLEQAPRRRAEPRSPQRPSLSRDGTDLAAGIQRALSEAPADAALRVVVVSDGVATRGNVDEALISATIGGVPVDAVALEQRPVNNVRVQDVRAPARADANESIDLRVTTRSTVSTEAEVEVLRDGQRTSLTRRRIPAGEDVLFVREDAGTPGLHRYEVRVSPLDPAADTVLEDDRASTFVHVKGPSRALVLETDEAAAAPLRAALEAASFLVDVVSATRSPETLMDLSRYDLVVLGALPAADFSPEQLSSLATHAQNLGGGLLLLGSDRSLGPGGYAKTPIEEVSPVAFDLPNERRRARLAEVILVDYSGSMSAEVGGHTKLSLANDAAARSGELLGATDRLGVAHVDTQVSWTLPIAPAGASIENSRRIRGVTTGGGGIYVDVALDTAYRALAREAVELKHVLLFADGADAEERTRAPQMAEDAARQGTTTSVVALGRGDDVPGLERISRLGRGRFYLIEDARRLPAVFAQETTMAAGNAIAEVTFQPAVRFAGEALRGFDPKALPALSGYVVTTKKARATTLLSAADGDPLLATWAAGIGHAATFTSDYGRKWGAAWAASPEAAQLFAQLARELARRPDDPRFAISADTSLGVLDVRVTRLGDDAMTAELEATVVGPDGVSQTVPLRENGPGTYHAAVPLSRAGSYVVSVIDDGSDGRERSVIGTTGVALSSAEELEATGTDHGLLARIARSTGGTERKTLAGIFEDRLASRGSFLPLAPWLEGLAAFLLFASVAARRLSISMPAWSSRFARRTPSGAKAPVLQPDSAASPETTETTTDDATETAAAAEKPQRDGDRAEPRAAAPPKTTAEELLRRRKRRE